MLSPLLSAFSSCTRPEEEASSRLRKHSREVQLRETVYGGALPARYNGTGKNIDLDLDLDLEFGHKIDRDYLENISIISRGIHFFGTNFSHQFTYFPYLVEVNLRYSNPKLN